MSELALSIVLCTPVAGRERDFEDWFDRRADQILAVDGWVGARRYAARPRPAHHGTAEQPWTQMLVYEIEGDVGEAFARLDAAPRGERPDGLIESGHANWVFAPATEWRSAPR